MIVGFTLGGISTTFPVGQEFIVRTCVGLYYMKIRSLQAIFSQLDHDFINENRNRVSVSNVRNKSEKKTVNVVKG